VKRLFLISVATATLLCADTSAVINYSSLGVQAGTMGIGLDYSQKLKLLDESVALKVAVAGFSYSTDFDDTDILYNANLKLANIGLLVDYHPFGGGFYISAGVYYNGNSIDYQATPIDGAYEINNNVYSASEIDNIRGETDFSKVAPFIGIGYDNSLFGEGSLFFSSKLGVLYQGSPNIDLTGTCDQTIDGTLKCDQFKNDIEAEQKTLNEDTDSLKWWPVVSIGVTYTF